MIQTRAGNFQGSKSIEYEDDRLGAALEGPPLPGPLLRWRRGGRLRQQFYCARPSRNESRQGRTRPKIIKPNNAGESMREKIRNVALAVSVIAVLSTFNVQAAEDLRAQSKQAIDDF